MHVLICPHDPCMRIFRFGPWAGVRVAVWSSEKGSLFALIFVVIFSIFWDNVLAISPGKFCQNLYNILLLGTLSSYLVKMLFSEISVSYSKTKLIS